MHPSEVGDHFRQLAPEVTPDTTYPLIYPPGTFRSAFSPKTDLGLIFGVKRVIPHYGVGATQGGHLTLARGRWRVASRHSDHLEVHAPWGIAVLA